MRFDTYDYPTFLAIILIVFYLLPFRFGKVALLIASYYFYAGWNPYYVPLLMALTVLDFGAAQKIALQGPDRNLWLAASIAANVLFLGFFKYANFVSGTVAGIFGVPSSAFVLQVVVPLGISFHTFQSIAYVVDVHRGKQQPIRNLLDYALFIAFFPQLVAGPIVRAQQFFPQLANWRRPTGKMVERGLVLLALGYVKKVVAADHLATIATPYFAAVNAHPGLLPAWSASVAFGLEIYFDFSAYTDIALGSALLLGFVLPQNFDRPYFAGDIGTFWRRWHMSLSSWLRDYVYIPLGGSRAGRARTYANLMATMLLGGLWHGAAWHFVAWGGYHGALLSIRRALDVRLPRLAGVVLTFALVTAGWVLFRANNLGDAFTVIGNLVSLQMGTNILDAGAAAIFAAALAIGLIDNRYRIVDALVRGPVFVRGLALGTMLTTLLLFAQTGEYRPFIYFQF
jgi:alginate O-acetyltransferase complex protein AlgI